MSFGTMMVSSPSGTISFKTAVTRFISTGVRFRAAKAVTRIKVPSSSRMLEATRAAIYSRISSGTLIFSFSAFFLKIAIRVSSSGAWMSVIRPHSKRESMRSSKPVNSLGGKSDVITTCLL